MGTRRTVLATIGIGAILAGTCAVTGVSYLPVSVSLGPCLKDWTSPSSYKPRVSPFRSERFQVGTTTVLLCYGSPAARGREVFGGLVPWDSLWRLGANEPTRLYVDGPLMLGGTRLEAGRYSLYALPRPEAWTFYVNRSITHWGNDLSPGVRKSEIGSFEVPSTATDTMVEAFSIRPDRPTDASNLVVEWEHTQVAIPLASVSQ